jgi:hypothetical protein
LENGIAAAIKEASEASKEKPVRRDPAETTEEMLELIRAQHRMFIDLSAQFASRSAPIFTAESYLSRLLSDDTPTRFSITRLPDGRLQVIYGTFGHSTSFEDLERLLTREGIERGKIEAILAAGIPHGKTLDFPLSAQTRFALRRMGWGSEPQEGPQGSPTQSSAKSPDE